MNLGGKLAGNNPVMLMGALTTAYGIGQVTAPLYSVALIEHFKSYDYTLYVTAFIVFCFRLSPISYKKQITNIKNVICF